MDDGVPTVRITAKERVYQGYLEKFSRLLEWEMDDVVRYVVIHGKEKEK